MLSNGDMNEGGAGPGEHPPLEELAALIDGRLSEPDAANVRSHLAACAECREVFFETVDFVRDEEAHRREKSLLPFRRRPAVPNRVGRRSRWRSALALPAAAILAVGGGYAVYFNFIAPPDIDWVAAATAVSSHPQAPLWSATKRGGGEEPEESLAKQSFRLGVAQVNLQVGIESRNREQADTAAARINQLNEDIGPPEPVKRFYRALRLALAQQDLSRALALRAAAQARHGYVAVADPVYLDFGHWTEAGNIATEVAEYEFLTRRSTRRFPSYLLDQKRGELDPKVVRAVLRIEHFLGDRSLKNGLNHAALIANYATILSFYEPGGGSVQLMLPVPPRRLHRTPPLPKGLSTHPEVLAGLVPRPAPQACPAPAPEAFAGPAPADADLSIGGSR